MSNTLEAFASRVAEIPETCTPECRARRAAQYKHNQTQPLFHAIMDAVLLMNIVGQLTEDQTRKILSVTERLEDAYINDESLRKLSPSYQLSRIAETLADDFAANVLKPLQEYSAELNRPIN